MIETIISGGQTGADQAALYCAKICGITTGGFAPQGFRTLNGDNPILLRDIFNLQETEDYNYKTRTWKNVELADASVRFAFNFNSPGERCTLNAIKHHRKPYLDIDLNITDNLHAISYLLKFHNENKHIKILNIAGNSELTSPGICRIVSQILLSFFGGLNFVNCH